MNTSTVEQGGCLDLSSWPARCTAHGGCGWEGTPTFVRGVAQTECPGCESEAQEAIIALADEPIGGQRRVESIPGRNDPCSCGSGIKYKRCCGR